MNVRWHDPGPQDARHLFAKAVPYLRGAIAPDIPPRDAAKHGAMDSDVTRGSSAEHDEVSVASNRDRRLGLQKATARRVRGIQQELEVAKAAAVPAELSSQALLWRRMPSSRCGLTLPSRIRRWPRAAARLKLNQ